MSLLCQNPTFGYIAKQGTTPYRDTPSWIGCDAVLEPLEHRINQLDDASPLLFSAALHEHLDELPRVAFRAETLNNGGPTARESRT